MHCPLQGGSTQRNLKGQKQQEQASILHCQCTSGLLAIIMAAEWKLEEGHIVTPYNTSIQCVGHTCTHCIQLRTVGLYFSSHYN